MKKHLVITISFSLMGLLTSACTNLKPIRDYAKDSQELISGKEVVNRWKDSDLELSKNLFALEDPFEPRRRPETQKNAEAAAQELYKIHDLLTEYFATLAQLAANELPSTKKQAESLADAIKMLDPEYGKQEQKAFQAIVELLALPLDAYRQKEVQRLIRSQHQNIEVLLHVLEQSTQVIESDIKAESNTFTDRFSALLGNVQDPGVRFLIRDRMINQQKENYLPTLAAIRKYKQALIKVRISHEKVAQPLSSVSIDIRQTIDSLLEARKEILFARQTVKAVLN